jgi:predicted dehydrogenase
MNRRNFLSVAGASAPALIPSHVLGKPGRPGANDRIQVGFIGLGGRASWLIKNEEFPGAQIVAVADCNLPRCYEAAKLRESGAQWGKYHDYRQMFEKQKLDCVFVETTTHARVRVMMHALAAGLDVYGEKPLTLTVAEGQVLRKAVRKHDRILQTGTQQRSMPINIHASRLVREGAIGKVHTVMVCNFIGPERWTPQPAQPMPEGLNWDEWCNQTDLRPYHTRLHRNWATWWDYDGGGQSWGVSGWGTHSLDQVQTALGTDHTGPVELWPEEQGPTCRITMRYANGTLVKLWEPKKDTHNQLGAWFLGENGAMHIIRGNYVAIPEDLRQNAPEVLPEGPGENRYHIQNFFECMRSRKQPNADVEVGHRSNSVCHLVNITRELGRKLKWDPIAERFEDDEEANARLARPRRKGYELPAV